MEISIIFNQIISSYIKDIYNILYFNYIIDQEKNLEKIKSKNFLLTNLNTRGNLKIKSKDNNLKLKENIVEDFYFIEKENDLKNLPKLNLMKIVNKKIKRKFS